ncbi:MAG TPA: endolytic transglycosylase MltG [Acidimicrobiales bacterium]|nr:endolytic transglycosylase MltG [Acidimicrobiales bacterium]
MTDLYDDQDDEYYEPFPKERRSKAGSRIAAVLAVLIVLGVFAAAAVYIGYLRQVNPGGEPGEEIAVTIQPGTSTQGIGEILADEGVITSAQVWKIYTRLEGASGFQAGEYTFRKNSSMDLAVSTLRKGPQLKFERVTVPEGLTLEQIADKIATLEGRSKEAFLEAARSGKVRSKYQPQGVTSLEGLILPETYNVEPKDNEEAILRRMVQAFDAQADAAGFEQAQGKFGITPYQAAIVASLIERETRVDDERPKVAQVIYNRLQKKMRLQIDATVVYALGRSGTDTRVLLKDLEIDHPYNTYKIAGLPPGPIAAPGAASIKAAMNPEPGPWLYYVVTEASGRHSFATTLQEHNANIRKAEAAGLR